MSTDTAGGPEPRIKVILDLVTQLAAGQLDARGAPSEANDELDSVITGLNRLAEELDVSLRTLRDRTAQLEAANQALLREIADRRQAEERLLISLKEKEVLLREIHHRVKNNLQIISSLLNLQLDDLHDVRDQEMFADSQHRVKAIALVHERLYHSANVGRVNLGDYVQSLVEELTHSYRVDSSAVRMMFVVQEVLLGIDQAVPCGLLVDELVSNAFKHAFPPGRGGEVRVELERKGESVSLCVSDNGIGFPAHLDFRRTTTLGLQLVVMLVRQLEGQVTLEREGGTRFTIQFLKE